MHVRQRIPANNNRNVITETNSFFKDPTAVDIILLVCRYQSPSAWCVSSHDVC